MLMLSDNKHVVSRGTILLINVAMTLHVMCVGVLSVTLVVMHTSLVSKKCLPLTAEADMLRLHRHTTAHKIIIYGLVCFCGVCIAVRKM